MASVTASTDAYKPFKMPQRAPSPAREDASTSRRSCSSCIGCQSDSVCTEACRALLVYKTLHDRLPSYLAEDCQLLAVTGHRQLHSSDIDACQVRRTNTRFGDRSFAAAGPRIGNSLPIQLRDSELSLEQFRQSLKTHVYRHIFGY